MKLPRALPKLLPTLREKMPTTRVLLLGLLPRQNEYFSGRVANINKIIAKLDDGKTVRFLDMGDQFQTTLGKVKPELYSPDQLHPVAAGYQVWADTMQPLFDALLKAPPLKAPPPPIMGEPENSASCSL